MGIAKTILIAGGCGALEIKHAVSRIHYVFGEEQSLNKRTLPAASRSFPPGSGEACRYRSLKIVRKRMISAVTKPAGQRHIQRRDGPARHT